VRVSEVGARKLEIVVPSRIWELLEKCEQKSGIKKEDLLMRSLIKVIEEFGVS
jgi:hypothetical protein